MATLTVATGNFWADKGALVIPTSVIASEDKQWTKSRLYRSPRRNQFFWKHTPLWRVDISTT